MIREPNAREPAWKLGGEGGGGGGRVLLNFAFLMAAVDSMHTVHT